jgi:hypothetical protein
LKDTVSFAVESLALIGLLEYLPCFLFYYTPANLENRHVQLYSICVDIKETMNHTSVRLIDLPNEILLRICGEYEAERFKTARLLARTTLDRLINMLYEELSKATSDIYNLGLTCKTLYHISNDVLYSQIYFIGNQVEKNNLLARTIVTTTLGNNIRQLRYFGNDPLKYNNEHSFRRALLQGRGDDEMHHRVKQAWLQADLNLLEQAVNKTNYDSEWKYRFYKGFWMLDNHASFYLVLSKATNITLLRIRNPERDTYYDELFPVSHQTNRFFPKLKHVEIFDPDKIVRNIEDLLGIFRLSKLETLILSTLRRDLTLSPSNHRTQSNAMVLADMEPLALKLLMIDQVRITKEAFVWLLRLCNPEHLGISFRSRTTSATLSICDVFDTISGFQPQLQSLYVEQIDGHRPLPTSQTERVIAQLKSLGSLKVFGINSHIFVSMHHSTSSWSFMSEKVKTLGLFSCRRQCCNEYCHEVQSDEGTTELLPSVSMAVYNSCTQKFDSMTEIWC